MVKNVLDAHIANNAVTTVAIILRNREARHTSIESVPCFGFILIKKKPNILTIISAVLCLASCFILTGMLTSGATFNLLGDKEPKKKKV
ncbi:MAG: hypothetical protein E7542_04230 [Ruminococcaceae bacterium]|nr:hypothetical protein [Oscillospiraceae bacterium]